MKIDCDRLETALAFQGLTASARTEEVDGSLVLHLDWFEGGELAVSASLSSEDGKEIAFHRWAVADARWEQTGLATHCAVYLAGELRHCGFKALGVHSHNTDTHHRLVNMGFEERPGGRLAVELLENNALERRAARKLAS